MIPRNYSVDGSGIAAWKELDHGTATICGFAELCRLAIISPPTTPVTADLLSSKAKALLVCAGDRGVADVRGSKDEFDSVDRFLAVCVETEPGQRVLYRRKEDPQQTVEFLDAFAELCRVGLVIHHLNRDFSLSASGFALATTLDKGEVQELVDFGVAIDD